MSKQSEAKAAQRYTDKAYCCSDCRNITRDMVLPAWMRGDPKYDNDTARNAHLVEKNLRCGIGGFAVKKLGVCDCWIKSA